MLMDKIVICVDAMGGDNAPVEIVKGAVESLVDSRLHIILAGQESILETELKKYDIPRDRIEIAHADEVIGTDEVPTVAIKRKKNSSIVVGLNLVKQKGAHAFVSAGNTGALLTGATVILGRISGIERPALATLLPNVKGFSFLIDSGANVDCKPSYLVQFAKMGSIYMENVLGVQNPSVGLVNIGVEKEKGNALTKEAYGLLVDSGLNFIGNIEARDIPLSGASIIVCDGFVGNVILKYSEGFTKGLMGMLKEELTAAAASQTGGPVSKDALINLKKRFDYDEIGGAPFLGLKALVVKAHGSSNAKAVKGAVNQCISFVEGDIVNKIEQKIGV